MNRISTIKFAKIIQDKSAALEFLCDRFEKNKKIRCPHCSSGIRYIMSKGRMRCMRCKADYNPFHGTWLHEVRIDVIRWLTPIKLFDLGTSARRAAAEAEVSYPVTLYAILHNLAKTGKKIGGQFELDQAYFGGKRKGNHGRGAKNKTIVFGILERRGKVRVEIVKNVKAKTLLKNTIKKVKRRSIVYTDKWRGYDSLMFSGYKHMTVDHHKIFASGVVYINRLEGFWSYAKKRLAKHNGMKPDKFSLYIKEMEWRYNTRGMDRFLLLVDYLLERPKL